MKSIICINCFCYENKLNYPVHISDQKCENSIDLLLILDEYKSHYVVYINDFDRFMFHKTKNKNKNTFAKVVYNVFVVKMYWQNIKRFV